MSTKPPSTITTTTLIPPKTPAPLRVSSPAEIRQTSTVPDSVARDVDNTAAAVNALHTILKTAHIEITLGGLTQAVPVGGPGGIGTVVLVFVDGILVSAS